jgi:TatD DNase family protein
VIDSHCHIAGPEFAADLPDVIQRAREAGVAAALVILAADDEPELHQAREVGRHWPEVRFSIGVHPHAAGKFADDPGRAALAVEAAIDAQPMTRALGEIGLDYHYDFAPPAAQHAVFAGQIELAIRRGLPLVIHTREADDDTFRILRETGGGRASGVFHCFTGDRGTARRALDLGFLISLAGIVTVPRALELQEVAKMVPLDRLLVETDSPFLAPVPHRGKRNEPGHVGRIVEAVAALRGVPPQEVADATRANFTRVFNP